MIFDESGAKGLNPSLRIFLILVSNSKDVIIILPYNKHIGEFELFTDKVAFT